MDAESIKHLAGKNVTYSPNHRRKFKRDKLDEALAGYLFLLPALAGLLIFLLGPIFYSLYISFFNFSFLDPQNAHFIGTKNYLRLFSDPIFLKALLNTCIYTIVVVPVQTALALFMAIIVNRIGAKTLFRVIYYLPTVTSTVAVSLMFMFILSPSGILNQVLALFGIKGPNYFNDPRFALPSIMLLAIWQIVGQFMIIYLAGLQDIPEDVYEAASLDGVTGWQNIWYITVPLLKRTTFLVVIMSMIGAFQVFDQVYVVSGGTGGPLNSTITVVVDLFNKAFQSMQMGYASAMAFVIFAIILALTLIQQFFIGKDR